MNNDEVTYQNDGKYRNFVNQIERCLKGFEYSSEWADLITNLGKLTKILQANAKYPKIPNKHLIGKRLSQCLHHALPGGVHLKALECYDVIFKNIGAKILSDDLFIYCNGLFPLMSPSAMSVKKPLFDLYETHFLPLNQAVKPAFVGLLQGLLPGLEEGAEFYERANSILEKFSDSVEKVYFYTCLWKVMLQAPSIRIFGTTFLITHFNKRKLPEDQLYLYGNNINLMLSSISQLLCDQQVLVQRQALDFVLMALNMHRSQLTVGDREQLCAACLSVLLRRDMSLNRRFYSWLLGSSLDKSTLIRYTSENQDINTSLSISDFELQSTYFKKYSKSILIAAVKIIIKSSSYSRADKSSIKPFRMILTLMDRSEIGGEIIENILFDMMVYMQREYFFLGKQLNKTTVDQTANKDRDNEAIKKSSTQEEFLKTANLFFTNLDGGFFWGFINKLLENTFLSELIPSQISYADQTIDTICDLIGFIITRLPIETYSDIYNKHLPALLSNLTNLLIKHVANLSMNNIKNILYIYRIIFDQIIQHETKLLYEKKTSVSVEVDVQNCQKVSSSTKQNSAYQNNSKTIQETIFNFRDFFKNFSIYKLGYNKDQMEKCVQEVFKSGNSRFTNLSKMTENRKCNKSDIDIPLVVDALTIEVYSELCHLLIEMTSFPILSNISHHNSHSNSSDIDDTGELDETIPEWLISLIISACFVEDFNIKSEAMNTMLDFLHATRSVFGFQHQINPLKRAAGIKRHIFLNNRSNSISKEFVSQMDSMKDDKSNNQSALSVNFPVLTQDIMKKLDDSSIFYQVAGLSLWEYLSSAYPQYNHRSVTLLNRLHQTAPSANICEDMILQKMLSDSVEESLDACKRFILMWQLLAKVRKGDNFSFDKNNDSERHFDKCMLVLLDSLDNSNESNGNDVLRTMCLSWLEKSFQKGYFQYIITPLLLGSLKPDTARISLENLVALSKAKQDPNAEEKLENEEDLKDEKRIYAISHENGSVKYHLKPKGENDSNNQYESSKAIRDSGESILSKNIDKINSNKETNPVVMNSMDEVMTSVVSDKVIDDESDNNSLDEEESNDAFSDNDSTSQENIEETATEIVEEPSLDKLKTSIPLEDFIYPLHNHLLIYCSVFDSNCVLYSLSRIKSLIKCLSGFFIPFLENLIPSDSEVSQSKGTSKNRCYQKIFELLSRHSNALKGHNFYQNPAAEDISIFKNYNYLEIIMLICTWFMCSYYPNGNASVKLCETDYYDNKKVQTLSSEIIDLIIQEMLSISQTGYINYRGDFVSKSKTNDEIKEVFKNSFNLCQIPKITLHCMSTSIKRYEIESPILSDAILFQNERLLDQRVQDSTQVFLLKLVLNVLKLDYALNSHFVLKSRVPLKDTSTVSSKSSTVTEATLSTPVLAKSIYHTSYSSSKVYIPVSRQSILLTSIVACLGAKKLRHLHYYYYQFIISSLGVWGQSTKAVLEPIVRKLCKNIICTAEIYENQVYEKSKPELHNPNLNNDILLDYAISTLECLKSIFHFLLLDDALKSYQIQEEKGTAPEHSLLGSLFVRSKESPKETSRSPGTHILDARKNMLINLPNVLHSILSLWEAAIFSENNRSNIEEFPPSWIMGTPDKIYPLILSIIKPILAQHSENVLVGIARVWPNLNQFRISDGYFEDPNRIINLCFNKAIDLKNRKDNKEKYRVHCILQFARGWKESLSLTDIIDKSRTLINEKKLCNRFNIKENEVLTMKFNLLEFLQCFLTTQSGRKLSQAANLLFQFLKEICMENLNPNSFICLKVMSDFLTKVPISEDRKDQREIQDLCQKIFENVASIAASSLEQPTWFRRAVQVRIQDETNSTMTNGESPKVTNIGNMNVTNELQCDLHESSSMANLSKVNEKINTSGIDFKGSRTSLSVMTHQNEKATTYFNNRTTPSSKTLTIQALNLLTMHLASVIDVIYKSEEKERVQPILSTTIIPNVLPYLRFRSFGNILNLRASSQLMSSLSIYQHTRRSWRKDIFDLLFEPYFFQFDVETLNSWKTIIDNLMTQDKSTFKEAFTKLVVTQGGGLNLFTSKEAEYDLNGTCLKKLAFIIYSSERDQYIKSIPEIQERLSDSLRLGIIPQIYTQLFLCFRIIILRMSHQHLISLWHMYIPAVIATIQNMINDLEIKPSSHKYQEITKRLPMYLSMAKLLDLILLMREDHVPQFLFHKWAFVGNLDEFNMNHKTFATDDDEDRRYNFTPSFKPLLSCVVDSYMKYLLYHGLSVKEICVYEDDLNSENLLIDCDIIQNLGDLTRFFFTACLRNEINKESMASSYGIFIASSKSHDILSECTDEPFINLEKQAESIIDKEFLESLNKS